MNNKLERAWKEAVMAKFKVLSWHLPEGTEKNPQSRQSVSRLRFEPRTSQISRSNNHLTVTFGPTTVILCKLKPVHILTTYFDKIHFNTIIHLFK
jgi:hypothetical protein